MSTWARSLPSPRSVSAGLLVVGTCGLLLLVAGCSSSPTEVVEDLGEHAQKRRLVQFRDSFSSAAQTALSRQFAEDGLAEAEGWRDLMIGFLGRDRKAPEVISEEITGADSAVVKVSKTLKPPKGSTAPAQTIVQELSLVKQEDDWKLALGPMKYAVETAKKKAKEEKEKSLSAEAEDENMKLGDAKQKAPEKVKDINLDDF